VNDASITAMVAVLQQWNKDTLQPLTFFSKKMSTAQQRYSVYDRELLTIYEVAKHSRHMLEARHFVIYTDHKPLTYAFSQKRDRCSPRQFKHLNFISHFTTAIRHIAGQNNVVAEALSRVEAVCTSVSPVALAKQQANDAELSPFYTEPPPSGWRKFRFPVRTLIYTATHLERDHALRIPNPPAVGVQHSPRYWPPCNKCNSKTHPQKFRLAGRAE
jgi:hypothetical protein